MPVVVGTNGVLAKYAETLLARCNVYAMMMMLMKRREDQNMRKSEVAVLR